MFALIVMESGHSVIPILLLTGSLINILWFSWAYLSFEILILRVGSFYLNVILVGGGFSS